MFVVTLKAKTEPLPITLSSQFNGTVGYGRAVSCTISRNGDLVGQSFLQITLKKSIASTASGANYDFEYLGGQAGVPVDEEQPHYPAEAVIQVRINRTPLLLPLHYIDPTKLTLNPKNPCHRTSRWRLAGR